MRGIELYIKPTQRKSESKFMDFEVGYAFPNKDGNAYEYKAVGTHCDIIENLAGINDLRMDMRDYGYILLWTDSRECKLVWYSIDDDINTATLECVPDDYKDKILAKVNKGENL